MLVGDGVPVANAVVAALLWCLTRVYWPVAVEVADSAVVVVTLKSWANFSYTRSAMRLAFNCSYSFHADSGSVTYEIEGQFASL